MICDTLQHLTRYKGRCKNLDTAIDYLLLLFRQTLDRRTERDALQYAILLPIVTEHVLKREAFVSALALQALRRSRRRFRFGNLFG